MIRLSQAIFGFGSNLALSAFLLGLAVPGTHRIIYPEAAGLIEISDRVWTDAPKDAARLRSLANAARDRVRRFFGDEPPRPTLVLCTQDDCARAFGVGGNGLSIADVAVIVAPLGLTIGTLTHEMTHSRLHRRMGPGNLVRQPYPTWFDEGLATHVADHPRWPGQITAAHRARVRKVRHFWHWDDAIRAIGAGPAYRAAATEVRVIEELVGRKGLLDLIRRAEAGEDFDTLLSALR